MHAINTSAGVAKWPKAMDSRSIPIGVRRFKSGPPHHAQVSTMTELPWDAIAADWDRKMGGEGDFFQRHLTIPALNELLDEIEGVKILDAGCGNGFMARHLANHGATVTGIDKSKALIEQAREYDDPVSYRVGDITSMDLDETFDVIVCNNVIQHIEDYEAAIERFDAHLKEGGTLIITVRHPCFKPVQEEAGWRLEGIDGTVTQDRAGLSDEEMPSGEPESFTIVDYFDPDDAHREFEGATIKIINRTVTDHMQALNEGGFCITDMREPVPDDDARQERPELCQLLEKVPHFLSIRAERHQ